MLAAALKYALQACPESPAGLAFVMLAGDPERRRLVVTARDGHHWLAHYVPVAKDTAAGFGAVAITRKSAKRAERCLRFASGQKAGGRTQIAGRLLLHADVGQPDPFAVELSEFRKGKTQEGWAFPEFHPAPEEAAEIGSEMIAHAVAVNGHLVIKRLERDAGGNVGVWVTDESGAEIARAYLVQRGRTLGLPPDTQTEFPGMKTADGKPAKAAKRGRTPTKGGSGFRVGRKK